MSIAFCRFLLMAALPVLFALLHCVPQSKKPRCCPYGLACWSPPASGLSWFLYAWLYILILSGSHAKNKNHASPLLQAVAIPQLHSSGNLGMAPVAPLADGSRLKKQNVRKALHPFCFLESVHQASVNSLFHRSYQLTVIEITNNKFT